MTQYEATAWLSVYCSMLGNLSIFLLLALWCGKHLSRDDLRHAIRISLLATLGMWGLLAYRLT